MDVETRNSELSQEWAKLYNEDGERMARECYAPDCIVTPMGSASINGHEQLAKVEVHVSKAAPRRFIEIQQRHAVGDVVVVEALLRNPDQGDDWQLPFIAVLTFKNGKIVEDRTYADWSKWPGLA